MRRIVREWLDGGYLVLKGVPMGVLDYLEIKDQAAERIFLACQRYEHGEQAIKAILDLQDEGYEPLPIWISGTITDRSGRTLSGQTAEAFWNSVRHAKPFAIGFNCALGADLMRPHIAEMSRIADTLVAAYPNAGLPNAFGDYDEQPHDTACQLEEWAKSGLVNILGGCCGTTPDHIRHIAAAVKGVPPRKVPERPVAMRLSGLEPFELV